MNTYLQVFIVVFGYGAVSFTLLLICAMIVNRIWPEPDIKIAHKNQEYENPYLYLPVSVIKSSQEKLRL